MKTEYNIDLISIVMKKLVDDILKNCKAMYNVLLFVTETDKKQVALLLGSIPFLLFPFGHCS